MCKSIKTVFVTDVPFWKKESGAQLRIDQLVENLSSDPFDTTILLTQTDLDSSDIDQIPCEAPVTKLDPSLPPQSSKWAKVKWQVAAIANSIGWQPQAHHPTFEAYYPDFIVERFKDYVLTERPQVIIFEYATQTQLLRTLPAKIRNNLIAVLDTHDVLWKRTDQFRQNGHQHWITVAQDEEEVALGEYDLVIAIQEEESRYFNSIVGNERVAVTGMEFAKNNDNTHSVDALDNNKRQSDDEKIVIGFLASQNWANEDTAMQMLGCWPQVSDEFPQVELLIAGSVCESQSIVEQVSKLRGVKVIGRVPRVDEFYNQVDMIWNPVRFGTGLKIKNLEALSYSKCLVTSPHGSEGLKGGSTLQSSQIDDFDEFPFVVLQSAMDITRFLSGRDLGLIRHLGRQGQLHLEKHFGQGTQYPILRQKIGALLSKKMG